MARGRVFCSLENEVHILDVKRGKTLDSGYGPKGMLALASRELRPHVLGGTVWDRDERLGMWVDLQCLRVHNLAGSKVKLGQAFKVDGGGLTKSGVSSVEQIETLPTVFSGTDPGMWLLISPVPFRGVEESQPGIVIDGRTGQCTGLCPIGTIPAAYKGSFYGFSKTEGLLELKADASYLPLVEPGQFPRGARPGPASIARNVIFFQNWAVNLETGRVLWCLPDLDVEGQAIPAADDVLVVVTTEQEVLGLSSAAKPAADPSDEGPVAAAPHPDVPGDEDGVFLADGTFLEGKVEERPDGRVRVTPGSGKPRDLGPEEVALAQRNGEVIFLREEYAPYRIERVGRFQDVCLLASRVVGEAVWVRARSAQESTLDGSATSTLREPPRRGKAPWERPSGGRSRSASAAIARDGRPQSCEPMNKAG